jgi:hypothetical protein
MRKDAFFCLPLVALALNSAACMRTKEVPVEVTVRVPVEVTVEVPVEVTVEVPVEVESTAGFNANVTVVQALLGTGVNEQQQLTGLVARAFPAVTNHIYAVLVLRGVHVGQDVVGRWYQLSVADAPPEGALVSEAGVTLVNDYINADGLARVALDLGSNSGPLPPGDWLVRVYVDGDFVRTLGFVITSQLGQ